MFDAYFLTHLDLTNTAVLAEVARQAGQPESQIDAALNDAEVQAQVKQADERARTLLETYKEEAIRCLRDLENASLKGLLRRLVGNLGRILAVELLASARAIELRAPLEPAEVTGRAVAHLHAAVPGPGPDRFLAPDLAAAEELVWAMPLS